MGECQRGYFEFETKEDGLYLTVYPPKTDMRPVSINEILYYVEKENFTVVIQQLCLRLVRQELVKLPVLRFLMKNHIPFRSLEIIG